MIKLITRDFVFNNFSAVTSQIAGFQKDTFDDDPENFEPDDDRQWYYEMHDALDKKIDKTNTTFQVYFIDHPQKSTYAYALLGKIIELLLQLGITKMVLLSHLKLKFVEYNIDPKNKVSQRLIEKFISITGNVAYDEAFLIDDISNDLPDLIDFAFWMGHFGGGCPEFIYFADTENKLAFHFCQYGYMHFLDFKSNIDYGLDNAMRQHFVKGKCNGYLI